MLPKSILEAVLLASPLVTAHDIHHEASDGATINPRAAPPRGKDTSKLSRPKLGSVPYGPNLKSCTVPGKVALTFDDGPYAYTSALLDLLAKNKAKATFFLNANNVDGLITDPAKGYIPVVKRMFNEGHHIGSHSYTHANFDKISTEERRNEIIYNEIAIADIIGVFPTYFRPPYTACGGSCESDISALGYHVANYDVDTKDWEGDYNKARQIFSGAIASGNPKGSSFISLAHDIHQETVVSLVQFMIDQARKYGFELTTMGDCLGDAPANWYRNVDTGLGWSGRPAPAETTPVPETTTSKPPTSTVVTPTSTPAAKTSSTPVTSSSTPSTSSASSTLSSATSDSTSTIKHTASTHAKPTDVVAMPESSSSTLTPTTAPSSGMSPVRDGASAMSLALALFAGLWMF